MDKDNFLSLKKFVSEIQMLKRVKREGFRLSGVEFPDSVAEHVVAAAQIAFVLAELEGADPFRCAAIVLFHDNHEIRIGDQHKVSTRYYSRDDAELLVEDEQLAGLGEKLQDKISKLLTEKRERNTKEGIIAQDADWLEAAIQAKVLSEQGYKGCQNWIDNVEKAIETVSAKRLLQLIKEEDDFINCWWQGLKKMTYTKLNKNSSD